MVLRVVSCNRRLSVSAVCKASGNSRVTQNKAQHGAFAPNQPSGLRFNGTVGGQWRMQFRIVLTPSL
jgi:hypothetical protein